MYKFMAFMTIVASLQGFEIQGHRGERGLFPENTLPSFESAMKAGVDAIELDVHVTSDLKLAVQHNFYLNPVTSCLSDGENFIGLPLISEMTLASLKELDFGRRVNPLFPRQMSIPGTKIPSLEEVFELVRNSDTRLNIEIKIDPLKPEQSVASELFADLVLEAVNKSGLKDRIYLSSFCMDVLAAIRQKDTEIPLGFIFETRTLVLFETAWIEPLIKAAKKFNITTLSADYKLLDRDLITRFHKEGFKVIPWTVNSLDDCKALLEIGVDGVITDYPTEFCAFRASEYRETSLVADQGPAW